jgi:3-hydroxybutyryl-CoA dehydrogenase
VRRELSIETQFAVGWSAELTRRVGKSAFGVKNSPGLVVRPISVLRINEAFFVLAEGIANESAGAIDAGMKPGANYPIGPLELVDLIGLDVCFSVVGFS